MKFLNKECKSCGKKQIKIIHHKEYGKTPKLTSSTRKKKENLKLIEKYTKKYLEGFCSKRCHFGHERIIRDKNNIK